MSTERYDIFFSGQIMEGEDEAGVRKKIGAMFKASPEQLERLFSGKPVKIKSGVDLDKAVKYRVAFRDAGALVDIHPAASDAQTAQPQPATAKSTKPAPDTGAVTLLPPNTGSLIDCAPEIVAAPIPDISGISLAEPGATIDESEPPPPVDIDTEDLVLNPPRTGSLEDCRQAVEAMEIPDISALKIVDPEERE
ncbi:MAG TPA: hypothetical protein ENI99_08070 [Sedimenticola sp.]|nr:hypothetical protein [Sedimenticola sp.]